MLNNVANLQTYNNVTTPYVPFSAPITIDDYPSEEKLVKDLSGYRKKKFYDISKLRDKKYTTTLNEAIDKLIELFPDHESVICRKKGKNNNTGIGAKANVFRLAFSRDAKEQRIYIFIEFKYEPASIVAAEEEEELFNAPKRRVKPVLVCDDDEDGNPSE